MSDRVRLTVPSEPASLALVRAVAERYCDSLGIARDETDKLVPLVLDAVHFTLAHSYPDDPSGEIELTLDHVDDSVRVDIHDWGRPLASAGGALGDLPAGLDDLAERTDDLRLVNLGAEGKRISFGCRCRCRMLGDPGLHSFDATHRAALLDGDVRSRIEVRNGVSADSEAISQLLYENYHLTYGHPDFYRPRWVAEQLETGALLSSLAVLDGEIIGHHAVMRDRGKASAETGVAVVHPAYRGLRHLQSSPRLHARALRGRWTRRSLGTRRHRASLQPALGAIARLPGRGADAGLGPGEDDDGGRGRSHAGEAYGVAPRLPDPATLVARRCVPGTIRRAACTPPTPMSTCPVVPAKPVAEVDRDPVSVAEDGSRATGFVTVGGWDEAGFARAIRHLLARHHDVIYVDLDLHRGVATDDAVDRLTEFGFFYSGLVVYGSEGHDYLRMQRMNAENVELDEIVCDAPYAQDLLRAVLADRARAEGQLRAPRSPPPARRARARARRAPRVDRCPRRS